MENDAYLIGACRNALDAWVRLIELTAHEETTMTNMTPTGEVLDALEVVSEELLLNAPYLPLMAAMETLTIRDYPIIGGPNDGGFPS